MFYDIGPQLDQNFPAPLKACKTVNCETDYITMFITVIEVCGSSFKLLFEFSHLNFYHSDKQCSQGDRSVPHIDI